MAVGRESFKKRSSKLDLVCIAKVNHGVQFSQNKNKTKPDFTIENSVTRDHRNNFHGKIFIYVLFVLKFLVV